MNIRSLMVAWLTMVALYARPTEASDVPVGFEYPCIRVALSDPDNDCWTGMDLNGNYPVPVDPDRWLVGPPPSELSGVTLPTDHWVELGFCGPIGDGPGPDIVLTEQGRMGEQALILLGDGRHCPVPIAVAAAESTGSQTITVINIDLAGVRLPFVPTTIRMLSLGLGGRLARLRRGERPGKGPCLADPHGRLSVSAGRRVRRPAAHDPDVETQSGGRSSHRVLRQDPGRCR